MAAADIDYITTEVENDLLRGATDLRHAADDLKRLVQNEDRNVTKADVRLKWMEVVVAVGKMQDVIVAHIYD